MGGHRIGPCEVSKHVFRGNALSFCHRHFNEDCFIQNKEIACRKTEETFFSTRINLVTLGRSKILLSRARSETPLVGSVEVTSVDSSTRIGSKALDSASPTVLLVTGETIPEASSS